MFFDEAGFGQPLIPRNANIVAVDPENGRLVYEQGREHVLASLTSGVIKKGVCSAYHSFWHAREVGRPFIGGWSGGALKVIDFDRALFCEEVRARKNTRAGRRYGRGLPWLILEKKKRIWFL